MMNDLSNNQINGNNTASSCSSASKFRTQRGRLSHVVVIDVDSTNLNTIWPYLLLCIKNASFISLDLELSGLGIVKGWLAKNLEERYSVLRASAQSRSILSVGISTFQLISRSLGGTDKRKKRIKYKCNVFNLLTLCSAPFVVETDGLKFLSKHKFDFNRLINSGIPYDVKTEKGSTLRTLWLEILSTGVPITFHNGLVDLVFLYQHFYLPLPESFTEFVANVSDWLKLPSSLPALFDSKYLSEYVVRYSASFLEYVFRKCQRENAVEESMGRTYVSVQFDSVLENSLFAAHVEIVDCMLPDGFYTSAVQPTIVTRDDEALLCKTFSSYGFCRAGDCLYMHSVDMLLDLEEQKQAKVRKRRKRRYDYDSKCKELEACDSDLVSNDDRENGEVRTEENDTRNRKSSSKKIANMRCSDTGCHRAGVDSFMTGFAVAFMERMSVLHNCSFNKEYGNKISLPGKLAPMFIQRSEYIRSSDEHTTKMAEIERKRRERGEQKNEQTSVNFAL